jgi:outer membrane lipoprotein carrier protein
MAMTMSRAGAALLILGLASGCRGSEPALDTPPQPEVVGAEPVSPPGHVAPGPDAQGNPANPAGDAPAPGPAARPTSGAETPVRQPVAAAPAQEPVSAAPADSAARILGSAAERYRTTRSLQADFTMRLENTLLRSTIESAGVLYQERPDRLALRFTKPDGDVILSDGQYFWVYYPSVDAQQVMRSAASAGGSSGVDLQAQFLGDPTTRFRYTLEGAESVGGRAAWRLLLVPRERAGYRSLRVWLDQRDHLARRFEIHEDNGSVRRFELSNVRINPSLPDRVFRFQPPAGARVIAQ